MHYNKGARLSNERQRETEQLEQRDVRWVLLGSTQDGRKQDSYMGCTLQ